MRAFKASVRVAVVALFAGCMTQPPRQDPFAALGVKPKPAYGNVTLALLLSPNSVQTRRHLDEIRTNSAWNSSARAKIDPDQIFGDLNRLLRGNFKQVIAVDAVGDATGKADLVAVLDVYAKVANRSGNRTTVDDKIIFATPDETEVEVVAGTGSARIPFPANDFRTTEAADAALAQLQGALLDSAKLKEFARARVGAASLAAAAPAAPIVSDVDKPGYRTAEDARNFALVVGIEHYESLPPADFAERDAAAVREHLRALGFPERNIIYLTGPKAGRAGIEKYVESWLPSNVDSNSRVFVYFSGHGSPGIKTGQAYLIPWDGDQKFLENTGYPVKRLYEKLNALPVKQVLVALDSCFSGAGGRSVLPQGARPLVSRIDTGASSLGKVVVLTASGADEITGTEASQGHGLFTYYLLKGLNAKKGNASAKDLYDYLLPLVRDDARRDERDQTPQLMGAGDSVSLGR